MSATHTLLFRPIDRQTFDLIKSGAKTIESRAGLPAYEKIKTGDTIEFRCQDETFSKRVTRVYKFTFVEAMLKEIPLSAIAPAAKSKQEFIERICSFPGYRERIAKSGLLAWKLT
ncbi:MAG: hypothetical protein V1895_00130 [Parcubacteria group bacterium]